MKVDPSPATDFDVPAMLGMLQSRRLLDKVKAKSKNKGVLEGKQPPSFDILAWNADSTNLPGGLPRSG
jgi:poly(3-hydroxyalkanoate) synthetase